MAETPSSLTQIWCMACAAPNDFKRRWLTPEDACTTCGAQGRWRRLNDPKVEWELHTNDKRLLKSLRIAQE